MTKTNKNNKAPTIGQIQSDQITRLANQFWSPGNDKHESFNPQVVVDVYRTEMLKSGFALSRVQMLEVSQYMERFLWPNYPTLDAAGGEGVEEEGAKGDKPSTPTPSTEHTLSLVAIINEKYRERVPSWKNISTEKFNGFFWNVVKLCNSTKLSPKEHTVLIIFLINCINSMEVDIIREQVLKLVSMPIWHNIYEGKRAEIFAKNSKYKKLWNLLSKRHDKLSKRQQDFAVFQRNFMFEQITKFMAILENITHSSLYLYVN